MIGKAKTRGILFIAGLVALSSAHSFISSAIRVGFPDLRAELSIGISQVAWVETAFFLPYVVFMPLAGKLADLYDRKRIILLGLLLYIVGTAAAALAPSYFVLILARILQGVGATVINPLSMAALQDGFPAAGLGFAMGVWQSSGPMTRVIGSATAGWVIEFSGWRGLFWITLGLALTAVVLVALWVPRSKGNGRRSGFDWPGTFSLALGLSLPLLAITAYGQENSSRFGPSILMLGGFVALGGFWVLESRVITGEQRLLDPETLSDRNFALGSLLGLVRTAVVGASGFLLPLFMGEVLLIRAGLVGLILGLGQMGGVVGSVIGGRVTDRFGLYRPNNVGMIIFALSMVLLSGLDKSVSNTYLIIAATLQGFGSGLCLVSQHRIVSTGFKKSAVGAGYGAYNAIRFFGSALGPILAGVLLDVVLRRSPGSLAGDVAAYASVFWLLAGLAGLATLLAFYIARSSSTPVKGEHEQLLES